jgi:hypothetical protein
VLRQEGIETDEAATAQFVCGQRVWVDDRPASFCYSAATGAAVVRYYGELNTRVVPARKLTVTQPSAAQLN